MINFLRRMSTMWFILIAIVTTINYHVLSFLIPLLFQAHIWIVYNILLSLACIFVAPFVWILGIVISIFGV